MERCIYRSIFIRANAFRRNSAASPVSLQSVKKWKVERVGVGWRLDVLQKELKTQESTNVMHHRKVLDFWNACFEAVVLLIVLI